MDGFYDCLRLVRGGEALIDINRGGSIHVHELSEPFGVAVAELVAFEDPGEIVGRVEEAARLGSPERAPASTPAVLTFRAIARIMEITVNDRARWDARNVGASSHAPPSSLDRFPVQGERRLDDGRFWVVLRDGEAMAVLDTDGFAYAGPQMRHLPTLYRAGGRRVTAMVAAAFGEILP